MGLDVLLSVGFLVLLFHLGVLPYLFVSVEKHNQYIFGLTKGAVGSQECVDVGRVQLTSV